MDEKRVELSLLLDFFGELLTEKQRQCLRARYEEDLSLGEIAENEGISRQGARDIIMRASDSLLGYEKKTGIIERHNQMRGLIMEIEADMVQIVGLTHGETRLLAQSVLEKLEKLKE